MGNNYSRKNTKNRGKNRIFRIEVYTEKEKKAIDLWLEEQLPHQHGHQNRLMWHKE